MAQAPFDFIPTPDPRRFCFRVPLDATLFNPTQAVVPGTPYKECTFLSQRPRTGFQGFNEYVYTYCSRDGDKLWFYFGPKSSPDQKNVPFKTFTTNENYPWPAVLEDVYFVESTQFPQSVYDGKTTKTAPALFPRYRYRPSVNVDSMAVVRQYLDAVPWPDADLVHDQPIPTDVNATYLGVRVNFPRCLHKNVQFKELVPGAQIVYGAGMVDPPPGRKTDFTQFPKTNFIDWAPFVLQDRQQPVNGMWLREQITIFPPVPPKVVIQ